MLFLGSNAGLIAFTNLIIQFSVLSLVVFGWRRAASKHIRVHGIAMITAVVLNAVSIVLVMGPSFLLGFEFIISNSFNSISIVSLLHHTLGLIVEIMGVYITLSWRLQKALTVCYSYLKLMKVTIYLWGVTFLLGFVIYLSLFL
jgi:uncharacterized membrane protein YozB (DUF420 family)